MKINVSEFFYSIQGEGVTTGIPSYFIRLQACNLLCGGYGTQKDGLLHDGATWRCDTIEVWCKGKSYTIVELLGVLGEEFIERIESGAHIVFTGGEPLMQQEAIVKFLELLLPYCQSKPYIEVETNGTILPTDEMFRLVDQWNVSPKLSNSGMPESKRIIPHVLGRFAVHQSAGVIFKFVIGSKDDWTEICEDFEVIPKRRIVLMPAAKDRPELEKNINIVADLAKEHCLRMCSRMHVTIWDKLTGV